MMSSAEGAGSFFRGEERVRPANVIDAHHEHDRAGAGLAEHVSIKAGKRIVAHSVTQDASAGNALIDDGDGRALLLQPLGQEIRPAVVGVER